MTEATAGRSPDSWLVVIDMQRVFADPESPWATPGFGDVLANNRALIVAFGHRVVFTRFVSPPSPEGAWVDYYRQWPFALAAADDPIYDLVESLPHAGHPVVSRATFGKYDELPGSIGEVTDHARTLVLTGVSTDCCVLSTALAAADAGVRVEVVADACAGLGPDDHQRALTAMSLYAPLISVTSTADVLGEQPTV